MPSRLLNRVRNFIMSPFSPIYALSVPVLFSLTLPLAFFASLTTIFAGSILLLRFLVIYTEIAFELIPHYLFRKSRPPPIIPPPVFQQVPQISATQSISPTTKAPKLKSQSSSNSSSTVSFAEPQYTTHATSNSTTRPRFPSRRISGQRKSSLPCIQLPPPTLIRGDSYLPLSNSPKNAWYNPPHNTPTTTTTTPFFSLPVYTSPTGPRDFEGLGGWRLDCAPEDTLAFVSINSRLELPGIAEHGSPLSSPLHHRRSLTGPNNPESPPNRRFEMNTKISRAGSFAGSGSYNNLKIVESNSRRNSTAGIGLSSKAFPGSCNERRRMVLPLASPELNCVSPTPLPTPVGWPCSQQRRSSIPGSRPRGELFGLIWEEGTYFPQTDGPPADGGVKESGDGDEEKGRGDSAIAMGGEGGGLGGGDGSKEKNSAKRESFSSSSSLGSGHGSASTGTSDGGVVLSLKMRSG